MHQQRYSVRLEDQQLAQTISSHLHHPVIAGARNNYRNTRENLLLPLHVRVYKVCFIVLKFISTDKPATKQC